MNLALSMLEILESRVWKNEGYEDNKTNTCMLQSPVWWKEGSRRPRSAERTPYGTLKHTGILLLCEATPIFPDTRL